MPVHYAVFNRYVLPNPDYDGEEDDNTREIQRMWDYLKETEKQDAEDELKRQERLLEAQRKHAEDDPDYKPAAIGVVGDDTLEPIDPWAGIAIDDDDIPEGMDDWHPTPSREELLEQEAQRLRQKYALQKKRGG